MKPTYKIVHLTKTTVAIIVDNGSKKLRRSFVNSNFDRAKLQEMLTKTAYNLIVKVWGKTATFPDPPAPTTEPEESVEETSEVE